MRTHQTSPETSILSPDKLGEGEAKHIIEVKKEFVQRRTETSILSLQYGDAEQTLSISALL